MSTDAIRSKSILEKKKESIKNPEQEMDKIIKKPTMYEEESVNVISEHSSDSHSVYEKEIIVGKDILT
jgi:hypothetical protein